MRVPALPVRVRPAVSEELKHGWIQYLAFFTLSLALGWIVKTVVFGYRILETSVYIDRVKSHTD